MSARAKITTKVLSHVSIIQFAFHDMIDVPIGGNTAFLGPNGAGKTTLLDAIQIAMAGAHGQYMRFNTQTAREGKSKRTIHEYCLGASDGGAHKRESATTYIVLNWSDSRTGQPLYAHGVCLRASAPVPSHELVGLFVLPKLHVFADDLVSLEDGRPVPRAFNELSEEMRRKCREAGATPHFGTRPESYIAAHLHLLSPSGTTINAPEFVKIFCQTLALKQILSVNDFVRDFVVTEVKVDAKRARAQIENFKRLRLLIEQVEERVTDLHVIEESFDKALHFVRRRVASVAIGHAFRTEELEQDAAITKSEFRTFEEKIRSDTTTASAVESDITAQEAERERAESALRSAPGAEAVQRHQDARDRGHEDVKQAANDLRFETVAPLSQVCGLLADGAAPKSQSLESGQINRRMQATPAAISRGDIGAVSSNIDDALALIQRCLPEAKANCKRFGEEVRERKAALEALEGQLRHAARGSRVSDATGFLLSKLHDELGIDAEPVASLVKVTDPSWQAAIESFLRRNREAIVVPPGRENEAVRLLRRLPSDLPRNLSPYGITIVQPTHLKGNFQEPPDDHVASLITGDHPAATAYLRQILGQLRMVDTEAELERHSRALTRDGMLSANGGTSRLRLLPETELLLGRRLDDGMRDDILQRHGAARVALEHAQREEDRIERALERITALGDLTEVMNRARKHIANAKRGLEAITAAEDLLRAVSSGELAPLQANVDRVKGRIAALRSQQKELLEGTGGDKQRVEALKTKLGTISLGLADAQQQLAAARSDPDFDEELTARIRAEMIREAKGASLTVVAVNYVRVNGQYIDSHKTNGTSSFGAYKAKHRPDIPADADWREIHAWVRAEKTRLRDTTLVEHKNEAESARVSAEDAFRTDMALRVRTGIHGMHRAVKDLNRLLRACPLFSNGERYEFVAEPIAEHKKLLAFVESVGEKDLAAAIGDDTEMHQQVMALIEEATDPGSEKAKSLLEDYRQLFNFDIEIERDGAKVSRLSKRLDVGSNGENRTPLYVAAGAAIAAAYRLNSAADSTGGAVMLLDEAFHGMDNQNARATANFLSALGLQLIMAGPDADTAKVASFSDVIYDVSSEDLNTFVEPIKILEDGQKLLASDMPYVHSHLLDDMMTSMAAQANAT